MTATDDLGPPEAASADYPFIVRAWPVDASMPPADVERCTNIDTAIIAARSLAFDKRYRSVVVTDDRSMLWAQLNMLWSIYA